jgi:hypothetical protein
VYRDQRKPSHPLAPRRVGRCPLRPAEPGPPPRPGGGDRSVESGARIDLDHVDPQLLFGILEDEPVGSLLRRPVDGDLDGGARRQPQRAVTRRSLNRDDAGLVRHR